MAFWGVANSNILGAGMGDWRGDSTICGCPRPAEASFGALFTFAGGKRGTQL